MTKSGRSDSNFIDNSQDRGASATPPLITGRSLSSADFEVPVVENQISRALLQAVFEQSVPAAVVRNCVSPAECGHLIGNFEKSPHRRGRTDGVPGQTLGVDLFGKSIADYLPEAEAERPHICALFEGTVDVQELFRQQLSQPGGPAVRPARHGDVALSQLRAVRWLGEGSYSLGLHDDEAQIRIGSQRLLETYRVRSPVALNLYPEVAHEGGEIEIVNVVPDDACRRRLGISDTGYPYPEESLAAFPRVLVRPQAGDLVILAGAFVHGVRGVRAGRRLLINQFAGALDDGTVVTWV